jgi:DNA repair protein RecO (recombination protein O)
MRWNDDGILLAVRKHGESGAIVELMTRRHGRHLGLARGARSKTMRPLLQPGNLLRASWSARLEEHLGLYALEPLRLRAALIMSGRQRLLALQSVCEMARMVPEREPDESFFERTDGVLSELEREGGSWPAGLVLWELELLAGLGFGLDLTCCAASGSREELIYVSPRSGRAVSREAGRPWRDKLLPLPRFVLWRKHGEISSLEFRQGLELSGFFLSRAFERVCGKSLPEPRFRLYSNI